MKVHLTALFVWLFLLGTADAQNFFGLLNDAHHFASAGIHAYPHLNASIDYLYASGHREGVLQRFGMITQVNFPLFSQKGFDFDLRVGAGALIGISGQFKTLTGLTWSLSRTADLNGRYFHSGFKVDLLPGYYGGKWAIAPHLSVNYQPLVHIKHGDYPKRAFQDLYISKDGPFTSPQDGWYRQSNLTLQTGIGIAYFRPRWNVNLIAGFQSQPNSIGLSTFADIGMMPFYSGLNFGYAILAE